VAGKKPGRKTGQQVYSPRQRGVALTIVDLMDGNVARAAQATGIERKTLFNWRQELERQAGELRTAHTETSLNLVAKLNKLAEHLSAIALMKAQSASVGEIRQLLEVILDKIERLSKIGLGETALSSLLPVPAHPETTANHPPPLIEGALQKAHWEAILRKVIAHSETEGRPITREEAIAGLVEAKPEAKGYLM